MLNSGTFTVGQFLLLLCSTKGDGFPKLVNEQVKEENEAGSPPEGDVERTKNRWKRIQGDPRLMEPKISRDPEISTAAVQEAIGAGFMSAEHGQFMDEETVKTTFKAGVWLNMQPFPDDEDAILTPEGSPKSQKQLQVTSGTDNAAKKHDAKIARGADTLFDPKLELKQGKEPAKTTRWFTPFEVLKKATHDNAQVPAMSEPRSPDPGELGVVKEGTLANLILVDGNPLQYIEPITDPDRNFV